MKGKKGFEVLSATAEFFAFIFLVVALIISRTTNPITGIVVILIAGIISGTVLYRKEYDFAYCLVSFGVLIGLIAGSPLHILIVFFFYLTGNSMSYLLFKHKIID